jgi:3-oxoacyl-[acyl-carrier-protein] synthase-1
MKRVVITGLGIVSCLGNDRDSVATSLREGRSGIRAIPEYAELGFRSQVAGQPEVDFEARIDRKLRRFMADTVEHIVRVTM